jgi:serine/threonine protein kinase
VEATGSFVIACLTEDRVVELLQGLVRGQELGSVEEHLDACSCCRLLVSAAAESSGKPWTRGPLSAFEAGELLAGRYRVVGLLGSGGMGEVYEVTDELLGERIALKCLAVSAALDEDGARRLKDEVQLARRVTHRHVCRVFDVGFHVSPMPGGPDVTMPFLTMELLRGATLRQRVRDGAPRTPAEALALFEQLAAGVDAAHDAGVVHADLKSENVMLVEDGADVRAVITDFGLAKRLDAAVLQRVGSGTSVGGTMGYMAPERLAGGPASPAADIYALGVVLFELLAGRVPFNPETVVAAVASGRPLELADSRLSALPRGYAPAVARCLAKEPRDRFARASDVVRALRQVSRNGRRRRRLLAVGVVLAAAGMGPVVLARDGISRQPAPKVLAAPSPAPPETAPSVAARAVELPESTATAVTVPAPPPRPRARRQRSAAPAVAVPPEPSLPASQVAKRLGEDDLVDPFAGAVRPPRASGDRP